MLPYTEEDICYMYRTSANKISQIKILAEINAVPPRKIVEVLQKHNCKIDTNKLPRSYMVPPVGQTPYQIAKDETAARYRELSERGLTIKEAAEELCVSPSAVSYYAKAHNLEFKKEKGGKKVETEQLEKYKALAAQGLTYKQTAEIMGKSVSTVRAYAAIHNVRFKREKGQNSTETDAHKRYKALAEQGLTSREAAKVLGVTYEAVRYHARAYHLTFKKEKPGRKVDATCTG